MYAVSGGAGKEDANMGEMKLLDCTLRDGGYVNDWKFGHNNIVSIFERIIDANVDIIEIGFLDDRRPFDMDRSIMPDTDSVQKIFGGLERKQAMVVGMIDFGTCDLKNIKPCSESYLDGIRVIFKKHKRVQALQYCSELKKMGYKVFAQLVSVTSYSDEEMMDLIRLANEVMPHAVSMVDTYGLMHQNNLKHYLQLLNENLAPEIGIGYHGHNNFQMGYANCIEMLSTKTDRSLLVDGSLYGMGKSAGNAPIELIAMYMNQSCGKNYHISQFLEAIDSNVMEFYKPSTWGYNMFYYLAASNDCHPSYVTYLMNKRTLSVKSINEILGQLEGEKQLMYDKDYIEQLYIRYQDIVVNDSEDILRLKEKFAGKKLLIAGPGVTMSTQKDRIDKFVQENNPAVISINYIPRNAHPDYVFLSNSKRYVQLATELSQKQPDYEVIATSNVTKTNGKFDYILNYSSLIDLSAEIVDNSLIMLLKSLINIGIDHVVLAGFDGYSDQKTNYFNASMEYSFVKEKAAYLNEYTRNFLKANEDKLKVEFLTDSRYTGTITDETCFCIC